MPTEHSKTVDAVVIGAGFGGLGAALTLAEGGHTVALCETLSYPGGCASTFPKDGHHFEAGATLFAGLGPEQLFGRWIARHHMAVDVAYPDPSVVLCTPDLTLAVDADRARFAARLAALPNAPKAALARWFRLQAQVADALWPVLADPALLPPWSASALGVHLRRSPRYAALLPLLGLPLGTLLQRHGLADFQPLRLWLDATCQITVQCPAAEAEALMALATADYFFRDAAHVHGGIGALAEGMVDAVRGLGGAVQLATRARGLRHDAGAHHQWVVETRRGTWRARHVVANLLPSALTTLLGHSTPRLDQLSRDVGDSWGACMRYIAVDPAVFKRQEAHHLELVADPSQPLHSGNHLFCSVSAASERGRAPDDSRVVTVSTHLPMPASEPSAAALLPSEAQVSATQARVEATLLALAPHLVHGARRSWTASPRTWQRFTGRPGGRVGGVPRRAGLLPYLRLGNPPIHPGLWLVGDSVFPGQSTVATALGGAKVAQRISDSLERSGRARAGGPR